MIPQSRLGTNGKQNMPGGIRAPTGYKKGMIIQSNLKTDVNVIERPISNHGVNVFRNNLGGPKRQIVDKSYFISQIKQRNADLLNETARLKNEIQEKEKGKNTCRLLNDKIEKSNKDARELEGDLADYNLAIDKHRTGTKAEDMMNIFHQIKQNADHLKNKLDETFIKRKELENEKNSYDIQIDEIIEFAKIRINELDPREKEEYTEIERSNKEINDKIKINKHQFDDLSSKILEQENRLRIDGNRLKCLQLKKQIKNLEIRKNDFEIQLNEANLPVEEINKRLKTKVKEDKEQILKIESRIKEVRKFVDGERKKIHEFDKILNSNNTLKEENKQNYEVLYNKEKEINNFINNFENRRQNLYNQIEILESNIQKTLETSSKIINSMVPPQEGQFNEVNGEKEFKDKEVENSERTLTMLKKKLKKYKETEKKLDNLEYSLPDIIKEKNKLFNKMKEELQIYSNIEKEKLKLENKKSKILNNMEYMTNEIPKMKIDLEEEQNNYNTKLSILQKKEVFSKYTTYEKKLQDSEQLIYNVKNFINSKKRDNNIDTAINNCEEITNNLNEMILKNYL